jgi:hypothetical protein
MKLEDVIKELAKLSGLPISKFVFRVEQILATLQPYDHNQGNAVNACHIELPDKDIISAGTVSEIIENLEKNLSKRQLAFLYFYKITEVESNNKTSANQIFLN